MRKQSLVLVGTMVAMLGAMLVVGLSFVSCENDTTSEPTLSGTYINVSFDTRYITFWPDGRYERVNSNWSREEGTYKITGSRIITEDEDGGIEQWEILSENTIRDQAGAYLWRK